MKHCDRIHNANERHRFRVVVSEGTFLKCSNENNLLRKGNIMLWMNRLIRAFRLTMFVDQIESVVDGVFSLLLSLHSIIVHMLCIYSDRVKTVADV